MPATIKTLELQPGVPGLDTYIYDFDDGETSEVDSNFGVSTIIPIGNASDYISRGLLQFDLSSIPGNARIISAVLTLHTITVLNDDPADIALHRSLVEWYEGDADGAPPGGDGSTWNERNANGAVAWDGATPGGIPLYEYASIPSVSTTVTVTGTDYTWDVFDDVNSWHKGLTPNYGWWLIGDEITTDASKAFVSSDDGVNTTFVPLLTITYHVYNRAFCNSIEANSEVYNNILYWWDLEEASGIRVDKVVGEIASESNGEISRTTGLKRYAAVFDESSILNMAPNVELQGWDATKISFSGALWFKPTAIDFNGLISMGSVLDDPHWYIYAIDDGTISFGTYTDVPADDFLSSVALYTANQWNFVAWSYDHTTQTRTLYVNNAAPVSDVFVGQFNYFFEHGLNIGNILYAESADGLTGLMDSIGLWKGYVFQQADVDWLYNAGNGRKYSELIQLDA